MNGRCPECGTTRNVRVRRGDKISNYECETCHVPLQGVAAGKGLGRYLCPAAGYVVTLGQTGVQLDRPMRLVWRAGVDGVGRPVTDPGSYDARWLARVGERVLGPGCVVTRSLDPDEEEPPGWNDRARLLLVDADEPVAPATWIVNEPLVYRKCAACGSRIPDLPEHHVPTEWTPRQTYVTRGRGRYNRHAVPIDPGPYPVDSLACTDCDPRRTQA